MDLLACPVCLESLVRREKSLVCSSTHAFDIAREGYVNLLLPQYRHSRDPGDNAAMVAARTRFLGANHFDSLAVQLKQIVGECNGPLVDLGCGEGYFTAWMGEVASPVYGIDISKAAIKAACKRARDVTFAVASTKRLPLAGQGFGIAASVMAPIGTDVSRVVRPGGVLIRVTPGPDHLHELKQALYADPRLHKQAPSELEQFTLVNAIKPDPRHEELSSERLADLVAMTPLQFRTSPQRQAEVQRLDRMSVTFEFRIDLFQRL